MKLIVTPSLAAIAGSVWAAHHADLIVSLDPSDAERETYGYAKVKVANPVARLDGVAVVVEDAALSGVPDPVRFVVRGPDTERESAPINVTPLRRAALPVKVVVDASTHSFDVRRLDDVPEHVAAAAAAAAKAGEVKVTDTLVPVAEPEPEPEPQPAASTIPPESEPAADGELPELPDDAAEPITEEPSDATAISRSGRSRGRS